MHTFKIEVIRDGRWWMVHIPEVDGITQARRLAEAETMAREYISLAKDIPYDDIAIETASVRIPDPHFNELLDGAREIREDRARAQELDRRATEKAHEYALWLTTYGVPVRDIATLLDVSPQRFSQLANTQHRPEKG